MTMKKTQMQHFYAAAENARKRNETFLLLVREGLTKSELEHLIKKRPSLYSRFSGWIEKLPA